MQVISLQIVHQWDHISLAHVGTPKVNGFLSWSIIQPLYLHRKYDTFVSDINSKPEGQQYNKLETIILLLPTLIFSKVFVFDFP